MTRALERYRKMTDILARLILGLAAMIVGLDVLSIFAEAVGRYIVGQSRAFMEELPRLAVPLIVFPMMGVLLKLRKHISVELLPDYLTGKARSLLMICVHAIILGVAVQFLIAGILAVDYYRQLGFETQTEIVFKVWVTYIPFPLGFALLILFTVEMLWTELANLVSLVRTGRPALPVEAEGEGGS